MLVCFAVCSIVMYACSGETVPKPRQPGGNIEPYQVSRCHMHRHCDISKAWVRDGLCDVCTARASGVRRCQRCQCIDYAYCRKKCDACVKLIERSQDDDDRDSGPGPYTQQNIGPEFAENESNADGVSHAYCKVCVHFKKRPENKTNSSGRSQRLKQERETGAWPGLVQLRKTHPEYVDFVEAELQKMYDAGEDTPTEIKLLMAQLGVYVSDEMKLRVYYSWKRRCGYVK